MSRQERKCWAVAGSQMGARTFEVAMGQAAIAEAPGVIISRGLGSCVALALYDPERKIGGLVHIFLPASTGIKRSDLPFQCADVAVAGLLESLMGRGATKQNLEAKIAGGASMFVPPQGQNEVNSIGCRIVAGVRDILAKKGIPLVGCDVGGSHGRSVEFHLNDGRMLVHVTGKAIKEI